MCHKISQFVKKHWSTFVVGIIGSLIASSIYWFILIGRRPQIEILPRLVKNSADQMHYIIFYHTMKWYCRKEAIDLKVTATLYGTTCKQSFILHIPLHTNEFPVFEAMEPWNEGKRESCLQIPITLDSKKFLGDLFDQVEWMGKMNPYLSEELEELKELNAEQLRKIPQTRFAACFENLFPNVYEKIQVSVSYQDAFSGIRNIKTIYINKYMEENLDEYKNWRMLSKRMTGG